MEGNCRPEAAPPSQLPLAGDVCCGSELARSTWDATTSLAAGNCENIFRPLENGMMDDGSEWTDEKHNSYLRYLEVSFVKQLHQSKSILAHCSDQRQEGINISQKQLINAKNAYEQKGNYARCESLSSNISLDSNTALMCKGVYNISYMGMGGSLPSTDMPEFLKLTHVMKYGKRTISCGLATSSNEKFPSKPSHARLLDSTTEGMGQNFLDERNQISSDIEYPAKRLKTVSADTSIQD